MPVVHLKFRQGPLDPCSLSQLGGTILWIGNRKPVDLPWCGRPDPATSQRWCTLTSDIEQLADQLLRDEYVTSEVDARLAAIKIILAAEAYRSSSRTEDDDGDD